MLIEGSCHCGAVRFRVETHHPAPYQRCYCSICRKAGGGGGFSINTVGDARTLAVEGQANIRTYQAMVTRDGKPTKSRHQRKFCGLCGCHLWAQNDRWPDLVHPVAGALDTELPVPPKYVHMMEGSKASWVRVEGTDADAHFDAYPSQSLADWHVENGLKVE